MYKETKFQYREIHQNMSSVINFLPVLFLCTGEIFQASAIKCLSCNGVLQPRYCTYVRQCPEHNTCWIQKYITIAGEVRYDVDCAAPDSCHSSSLNVSEKDSQYRTTIDSKTNRFADGILNIACEECCHSDICNSQGCGIAGYPPDRGLMCYNCPQESEPTKCGQFTFCGKDEICGLYEIELFGDHFYSSHCTRKTDCGIIQHASAAFGRRQLQEKPCTPCCGTDLCNDNCRLKDANTTEETTSTTESPTTETSTTPATTTIIYPDTISYEFLLIFQQTISTVAQRTLQAVIVSDVTGKLIVEVPYVHEHNTLMLSSGFNSVNFSVNLQGNGTEIQQRAVYLKSTTPISVFGVNQWHDSAEGYLALPIYALGLTYTIVSTEPSGGSSNFMIAATQSNTEVLITFRMRQGSIRISGQTYSNGMTYTLYLNYRLQTFHVTHDHDLSGTSIVSNRNVAVVSGTTCSHVLHSVGVCQPLQEYLIPSSSWGTDFVIPALFTGSSECLLKIWPAKDNTTIIVNDDSDNNNVFVVQKNIGKSFSFYFQFEPVYIKSDKPIQIVVFTAENKQRASTMVNIPSLQHYDFRYDVAVPSIGNYKNTLVLISKEEDQAGILVKGNITNQSASRTYSFRYGNYTLQYLDVTGSNFYLKHSNYKPFGVFVTGVSTSDDHVAYSYPGGMKFLHQ